MTQTVYPQIHQVRQLVDNTIAGHNKPYNFQINGDLEVNGNLRVDGTSYIHETEIIKQLFIENQDLKKRIEELERKLEMLWYAPGMPGFESCKQHFDDVSHLPNEFCRISF